MDSAKTQTEPFEKNSDENLILFFREEIKKIDEGEKATDLLSARVTRRLLELGILARTWQNTLILGEKGRHIIDKSGNPMGMAGVALYLACNVNYPPMNWGACP